MNTAVTVVGLVIGVMILCGGLYFLTKNRADAESKRVYGTISAVGAVIVLGLVIKVLVAGW